MNRDYQKIKEGLVNIGVKAGDSLLIHSSFKSLGKVDGGIQTLADALQSVVGDRGTLLFPTLSFASVTEASPVFSLMDTPSCVGAVSEYIRKMPGAVRSLHPTHSCAALGCEAAYFTQTHYLDNTPVGQNSPFFKLKERQDSYARLRAEAQHQHAWRGGGFSHILCIISKTHDLFDTDTSGGISKALL